MPSVLCIDFGSAYTKVALRSGEDAPADVLQDTSLPFDDEMFCIPSVVAGPAGDLSQLHCGLDAVGIKDTGDVKVYRNWKRQLLAPPEAVDEPDRVAVFLRRLEELSRQRHLLDELAAHHQIEVAQVRAVAAEMGLSFEDLQEGVDRLRPVFVPGGCDLEVARPRRSGRDRSRPRGPRIDPETHAVAVAYFTWLREFIAPACRERGIEDVSETPVRVCIPAFSQDGPAQGADALLDALREAGWAPHPHRPVLPEPLANAVGVLTAGVNSTWQPPVTSAGRPAGERTINLGKMFRGGPVQRALRNGPKESVVRVLAVDVGAYTADMAVVTFRRAGLEATHEVSSRSEPLGISELDVRVRNHLPTRAAQWLANTDVRRQEMFRRSVYGGVDRAVRLSDRETVTRDHVEQIQDVIRAFADDIAVRVEAFAVASGRVDELILTGGGSNIPALRETLRQRLGGRETEVVHMPSPETTATPGLRPLGQKLARGGSALGGASIYVDYQLR